MHGAGLLKSTSVMMYEFKPSRQPSIRCSTERHWLWGSPISSSPGDGTCPSGPICNTKVPPRYVPGRARRAVQYQIQCSATFCRGADPSTRGDFGIRRAYGATRPTLRTSLNACMGPTTPLHYEAVGMWHVGSAARWNYAWRLHHFRELPPSPWRFF